jgi:superfamily I DNA and/or RNA helicase
VIVCTCLDAHILFRAKITNEAIAKRRKCFRQYLLSKTNNLGFSIDVPEDTSLDPYFSHLFIDEAAQASEPEILIPMSCVIDPYPGPKKVEVALIGDPRQLR